MYTPSIISLNLKFTKFYPTSLFLPQLAHNTLDIVYPKIVVVLNQRMPSACVAKIS